MSLDYILRLLLTIGIVIGFITWSYFYCINKKYRNYTISPILFSIHALLFSILSGLGLLEKNVYLIWGDLVSIHGVIILISTGLVLIQYSGGKK